MPATRRPNIIVILADDLGYGDLRHFGNPDAITPCLDQLAREGVCLMQHYSGSCVCAPARAALLTGRYPHRTGAIDTLECRGLDRLSLREKTLADVLRRAGYKTGLVGKWHLGAFDPRYHPMNRGFDETACFRGGWIDYWKYRIDRNGSFSASDGRYATDVFTQEAVEFIERHRAEPFFLHVAYNAPHAPFQAMREDELPFQEMGRYNAAVCSLYGMIRRMDRGVGRIVATLDRLGLSRDTLILFTSDNGPQFGGGPGYDTTRYNAFFNGSKGNVYEGGIRVPAIVRWPGGLPGVGRQVHTVVHFCDWLPTLCEVAGVGVQSDLALDGVSAMDQLRGNWPSVTPPRFWQWNRYTPTPLSNAAMRDGSWKLVRRAIRETMKLDELDLAMDRAAKYEPGKYPDIRTDPMPAHTIASTPHAPLLFNVRDDPAERKNLADAKPDILRKMSHQLEAWFERVEVERRAIND